MRGGFLGVAGATAAAAVLTLLLFSTTQRAAAPADQHSFVVFWYAALVVSFGVFLPLEQVVSRAATTGRVATAAVLRPAAVLLALAVAGILAASPLLGADAATRAWVVTALVLLSLVSALQYAVRGLALGRGRLGAYAGALFADAGVRAGAAVAVALLVVRPPGAAFAACVVGSALVAHLGLAAALRRARPAPPADGQTPTGPSAALHDFGELGVATEHGHGPAREVVTSGTTRAVLALLGASLAAQLLLNSGPLLVGVGGTALADVTAYGSAFTLARAPLFVAVPAQAVLVPPMVRMVEQGRLHELRVRMAQLALAVVVAAVLGAGAAALLSDLAMSLFTGGTQSVPPALMALLVGGCLVHAGLVVGTQALVATDRERWVLGCWLTGLGVAAAVLVAALAAGAGGPWAVGWAFTAGSAAAWLLSVLVLVRRR